MERNTFIFQGTESFMRGELDNVTIANGRVVLDLVQGSYVPYGCYTSAPVPLPLFDALRVSWNAATPPGTAVEAHARVMVDGNWTPWVSFGRWSPYLNREGAAPKTRGPLVLQPDQLLLDSKLAAQAQLRIYLYTKDEKITPAVQLLGGSVRLVDVIPAGGRPVHANLHLMPYAVARRAPGLKPWMDLAIGLASLTNRWGADILPEEFAQALRDYRPTDDYDARNLCFAAAAAGAWGFAAWVRWADLALLREEARQGNGTLVALQSTPAQQAQGWPETRYVTVRGFAGGTGSAQVLLCDPWAGASDFDAETALPLDDFLVAWDNVALLLRKRSGPPPTGWPRRADIWLRPMPAGLTGAAGAGDSGLPGPQRGLFALYLNGEPHPLPDDYCAAGNILAWSTPDEKPHATTAHRTFHFVEPEAGGIRLEPSADGSKKYTVYAIAPSGQMLVGDITI